MAMEPKRSFKLSLAFVIVFNLSTAVQAFDREPCITFASTLYEAGNVTFLRDQYGRPTENISDAWGISYEACKEICPASSNLIDWSAFTNHLVSWLLPSLILLNHLPFQSASIWKNLQQLLLAIGSPILIIYSLAVTIFNTQSIKKAFREVEEENRSLKRPEQIKLIKSARRVLIECQSIPPRNLNVFKRRLAQLVVTPERWRWWAAVAEDLTMMRTGLTSSLICAIAFLLFTLFIHILEVLSSKEVDPNLGTRLGITGLWLWLVPVTLGWSMVGGGTAYPKGFLDRKNDEIEPQGFGKTFKNTSLDSGARKVPEIYGRFSVIGDEAEFGPLFNYARVWSHMRTSARVIEVFRNITLRQEQESRTGGNQPKDKSDRDRDLREAIELVSKYISAYNRYILYSPSCSNSPPGVLMNCIKAAIVALSLGWATTGGSFLITYMTPPIGLGCNSAVYLIYGVGATVSWLLLVTSAYLSDLYLNSKEDAPPSFLSDGSSLLPAAAVYLRISGKTLAFMNAGFVVVTSILQFTNLYSSCWCSSAVMSLGTKNGWVVLFATDSQIVAASEIPWLIGFSMSSVVSTEVLFFILRYRGGLKDQEEESTRSNNLLPNGLKRVRWKCACGESLYDDYKELRPGAAEELENSLRQWQSSLRSRNYEKATEKGRGWGAAIKDSLYLAGQQLRILKRNQQPTLVQTQPRYYSEDRATRAPAQVSGEILYLLLCHNAGVGAEIVKLRQPDVCDIDTDQRFFQCLKDEYDRLRKRWWSHTSLWTLQSIRFARFGLFSDNVVDIRKLNEVPPKGRDHEYRFDHPTPPDLEPPLGPKLLMHSFKHPECTGTGKRCLRMIPRRLNKRLTLSPDDSDVVGWGLQFNEGWSRKRLLYTSGILCGLGSLLVLILMSVLGKNIQNAAAIASFILAFVTAGIATLQVAMYMT